MRNYSALIALLCVVAGCSSATEAPNGLLVPVVAEHGVLLQNRSSTPIAFFIIEQDALAYTDFVLCGSPVPKPTDCGAIQPGETRPVPNTSIVGYRQGANAVVIQKRLVLDPVTGYYVARDAGNIVIKLR